MLESIEVFFSMYAGTLIVATLVAMAFYRITDKLIEDIWVDLLGHSKLPALTDSLLVIVMGLAGGLAGFGWDKNFKGALVGFGATGFGTLVFRFLTKRFK